MKQITIYLFAITTIIASCSSCKKETTPEFYYHCKLNGNYYVPFSSSTSDLTCYIVGDSDLIFGAYVGGGQDISTYLSVQTGNHISQGIYKLDTKKGPGGGVTQTNPT